jgi:hypothetical protein
VGQTIEAQSSLLAYIDVFWFYAIFTAVMILLALSLPRIEGAAAAPVH